MISSLSLRMFVLFLLSSLLVTTGCVSRAIKESYYGVTGSSGSSVILVGDQNSLANATVNYGAYKVDRFDNDLDGIVPEEFFNQLQLILQERLKYREDNDDNDQPLPLFTGPASRTLLIRGRLVHYETADLLHLATGPMEEAVCRTQFVDADTGTLLAEANCVGRVKSSVRTGPKEMADGVSKAIQKMLKPKNNH